MVIKSPGRYPDFVDNSDSAADDGAALPTGSANPTMAVPSRRLLLICTASLAILSNLLPPDLMEYDREAIVSGQLWRLWTGQFSHWSSLHLIGNLAAAALVIVIGGRAMRDWLSLVPAVAPLLSMFIWFAAPAIAHYRGMSGLVAFLVTGAAVEGGVAGRLLGVAYVAKLGFDVAVGGGPTLLPDGIAVAWPAHLGGIIIGAAVAAGRHKRTASR